MRRSVLTGGFLGQFARRLDPDEPRLERRRPARFEPTAPGRDSAIVEIALERFASPPTSREPAPAPAVVVAHDATAVTAAAATRAPPAIAAAGNARIDEPATAVARSAAPTDALRPAPALPPRAAAPTISETIQPAHTAVKRQASVIVQAPAAPVLAPAPPTPPRPAADSDARTRPPPPAPRTPAQPSSDAVVPHAPAPVPPAAEPPRPSVTAPVARQADPPRLQQRPAALGLSPQLARRTAPAAPRAPMPVRGAPPPIEVTIGRVEIRAVAPAAPAPQRARAAGPRLTLDDYLRSRGGGGSR
jgi:hypothetical protein